jgi:hypothetical protein
MVAMVGIGGTGYPALLLFGGWVGGRVGCGAVHGVVGWSSGVKCGVG